MIDKIQEKNREPVVSVIITTKNEEKNIENCLKSILQQTYSCDKVEIIVVDNGSADKTKEIASRYTNKVFSLGGESNLETVKNFRGAQLNLGVGKSKGEIIFFPDADMTFDEDLLLDAVKKIDEEKFDSLFVPEIICGKGYFGKIRNFERSFYNQTCIDGVRFIKKEVFSKVGGFDVKNIMFGPDDWDFTKILKKNNFRLGMTEKSLFHHEEWMNWKVYLNKKAKYVNTFDGYVKKWGKDDPDIKKQLGFYYRFIGVFVGEGKWKKIIAHPILTFGMYGLRFLVGLRYITRSKEVLNNQTKN